MRTAPIRSATPWRKAYADWDRRPEDVKRGIIREVGARLLAEHGVDGMSLQAIMRGTGVERSFYHKFYVAKADLVEDIAERYLERVYAALDSAGLDGLAEGERLGAMARVLARAAHGRQDEHRVLMMGLASLPAAVREGLRARVAWLYAGVVEAVLLRAPGMARAEAEARGWQLMLLLAGPPLWVAEWDLRSVEAAADGMVGVVMGVAPQPSTAASGDPASSAAMVPRTRSRERKRPA